MTKTRSTKRALLSAILALVMTVSMLVGTTFAWFTDSVTSAGNKIVAGNLDVELYMFNGTSYVDISNEAKPIFGEGGLIDTNEEVGNLWEPGKTQVVYLAIKNAGTLSLKYKVSLNVTDIENNLNDVVSYTVTPDAKADEADKTVTAWDGSAASSVVLGEQIVSAPDVPMAAGDMHYFALSVHMDELASNEYMKGSITFDLTVLAAQLGDENDSFGNDFDKNSPYPIITSQSFNSSANKELTLKIDEITVTIPADALDGVYTLQVDDVKESVDENGKTTLDCEIDLKRNGKSVNPDNETFTVTIQAKPMAEIEAVYHKDDEITSYTYDPITGIVSFETTSFSPFTIIYKTYSDNAEIDENGNISGGTFEGKNPADIDESLKDEDSEYVVIDYVKGGVSYYEVSEKATTVILAPGSVDGAGYENAFLNNPAARALVKENMSGKLADIFGEKYGFGYSDVAHTVYLLPGTYNEGSTIYIYADVTVMGLGNAEDVKVIKTASSNSNRHLFNVTGNPEIISEHIKATLKNMSLDATAKTTGGKDNAAVQAINLAKVKCYDLIINKSISGFAAFTSYAFYVNGRTSNNMGTYMYAENCTFTGFTGESNVVTTASPYTFYFNNLTYNSNKPYKSSQNNYLAPDEWDWTKATKI